jgi:hypothetical protein
MIYDTIRLDFSTLTRTHLTIQVQSLLPTVPVQITIPLYLFTTPPSLRFFYFVSPEIIKSYIDKLETQIEETTTTIAATEEPTMDAASAAAAGEPPFPPTETGEDFDKASELKQEAADAKSMETGKWLLKSTRHVLAAPVSVVYANQPRRSLNESPVRGGNCTEALNENPDSAKVLRTEQGPQKNWDSGKPSQGCFRPVKRLISMKARWKFEILT